MIILVSFFFNLTYSYFFFNNFSSVSVAAARAKNNQKSITIYNPASQSTFLSKHDLNWILYVWLTRSKNRDTELIEKLFDTHNYRWASISDFFINLYKIVYFTNLSNSQYSVFSLKSLIDAKIANTDSARNSLLVYFNNSQLLNCHSALLLNYFLNQSEDYFMLKNKNNRSFDYLSVPYLWNLYEIESENNQNSFLIKSKIGFFYTLLNYENYNHLFFKYHELWGLNFFLKNQLISAKWSRWLYRYSVLHRKSLKNSHKLTIAKKLINSGFYDNNFFYRNIWNSEYFSKSLTKLDISNIFNSFYKNLYIGNSLSSVNEKKISFGFSLNQKLVLQNFSFMENSFFFFLKRFFFLNTLSSNLTRSGYSSVNESTYDNLRSLTALKNNFANRHFLLLSYFLQNKFIVQNLLSLDVVDFKIFNNIESDVSAKSDLSSVKDLLVLFSDNDLFSTSILNILNNATSSNSANSGLVINQYLVGNQYLSLRTKGFRKNTFKRNPSSARRQSILNDVFIFNHLVTSSFLENTFLLDTYTMLKFFN